MARERLGNGSYTPGPWTVDGVDNGPGERHLHIGAEGRILSLASMNPTHIDTRANAALIAAAPDLYEALKAAVAHYEAIGITQPWFPQARAALASATGGTK